MATGFLTSTPSWTSTAARFSRVPFQQPRRALLYRSAVGSIAEVRHARSIQCRPEAQFTSGLTSILEQNNIRISIDGKGGWIDNDFIERFWRSIKYEEVYLHAYEDLKEVKARISHYINYYNGKRRHSSLGKRTPVEVYRQLVNDQPAFIPPVPASGALRPRPCS